MSLLIFVDSIVSIHAPARGATGFPRLDKEIGIPVSIHAPARGATGQSAPGLSNQSVSIHAPARGATGNCAGFALKRPVSIHAPARGATQTGQSLIIFIVVSIHAPARGATRINCRRDIPKRIGFNPRSREGSDASPVARAMDLFRFQSTLPRGERRGIGFRSPLRFSVSIHAPARGATG